MSRPRRLAAAAAALLALLALSAIRCGKPDTLLIEGALVADGSGEALRAADVRVKGDRIAQIGSLEPERGERVVEGDGLVLAPGFIDMHNHSAGALSKDPILSSQISQGITTVVLGPDGDSPWPVGEYLAERRASPPAVNVLTMAGHESVRDAVMGKDLQRAATSEETARMAALIEQAMAQGAMGLSSGLEYDAGRLSETAELIALAKAAAKHGGFYMTHIRDEGNKTLQAIAEAIEISEKSGAPLQISHIKLGTVAVWHKTGEVARMMSEAKARGVDATADAYPYGAWHTNIEALIPSRKFEDRAVVRADIESYGGASRLTISRCEKRPDFDGRDMADIARTEKVAPEELLEKIVAMGGASVIGHSMDEPDVRAFLKEPWVMIGSDGRPGGSHPRGAGTYPRVLSKYVREEKLLTLPEAIHKMTAMPAARLKLADRGLVREGYAADLVLFDPETVADKSTFADPKALSVGIRMVLINGQEVWDGGKATGARPGRVLTPLLETKEAR
ncbi:MAG TPA: D-aminoacylase [Thermoanaerobaculia bacterium]